MSDAANVNAGKPASSGSVFVAPLGTTLPTDAETAKDAAFVEVGYISSDGVTNSNSIESSDVKAWGGDTVLTINTSKTDTYTYTMIESDNINALKVAFGDANVTQTNDTISIKANNNAQANRCYIFEMIESDGRPRRLVVPNGAVSGLGDIVYKDDTPIGYPITLTAATDSNGNTHYEYIKKRP